MSKLAKALTAAAGNAAGESLYVEDVFSTYLYKGASATNNIVNNIDVSGEGGLIWLKHRVLSGASATLNQHHQLYDTERGSTQRLSSNRTNAQDSTGSVMTFNSDGFTLAGSNSVSNNSSNYYASWTFRKAEKFFDVVTYTGDGVAGRTVSHNLGSVPACIIVKRLTGTTDWNVYHSAIGATKRLKLNTTDAEQTLSNVWNNTTPTEAVFTLGTSSNVNNNGDSYVAYLFASDAGGFGDDGSESIIKCGSFVPASTWQSVIDIGFEPQLILFKKATSTGDWYIHDNMRGINTGSADPVLSPNKSDAEIGYIDAFSLHANGFEQTFSSVDTNTYIYIAIRRPMKTPESGTEVFAIDTAGGTSPTPPTYNSGFPVDFFFNKGTGGVDGYAGSRLQGAEYLTLNSTAAATSSATYEYDYMNGARSYNWTNSSWYAWMFKRATGFFDVVAYTGNGVAGRTVAHNLGAAPELMIVKVRDSSTWGWVVYAKPAGTGHLQLNNTQDYTASDYFNYTNPTDSVFYVSDQARTNLSGGSLIAYLFATLAGVSKVGSYTGTGSNVDVDCGFSAGARFILIKRTDSSGDWYVWDSLRGIVAGNDPYILLNSTAAEVTSTDYIDPLASGFTVTSSAPAALNASGGTYIFLAIA